jgi:hypothetical protein
MERSNPLERRLRERRYEKATRASGEVLEGIGIATADQVFVSLDDVELIWSRYLTHLREGAAATERWPVDEREAVQHRLDQIADRLGSLSAVWLTLDDSEPIGVEVSADPLLRAALSYFVS